MSARKSVRRSSATYSKAFWKKKGRKKSIPEEPTHERQRTLSNDDFAQDLKIKEKMERKIEYLKKELGEDHTSVADAMAEYGNFLLDRDEPMDEVFFKCCFKNWTIASFYQIINTQFNS